MQIKYFNNVYISTDTKTWKDPYQSNIQWAIGVRGKMQETVTFYFMCRFVYSLYGPYDKHRSVIF